MLYIIQKTDEGIKKRFESITKSDGYLKNSRVFNKLKLMESRGYLKNKNFAWRLRPSYIRYFREVFVPTLSDFDWFKEIQRYAHSAAADQKDFSEKIKKEVL